MTVIVTWVYPGSVGFLRGTRKEAKFIKVIPTLEVRSEEELLNCVFVESAKGLIGTNKLHCFVCFLISTGVANNQATKRKLNCGVLSRVSTWSVACWNSGHGSWILLVPLTQL